MCDQEHILCEWVSACNKAASHKYSLTIKARQFVKCVQVFFFAWHYRPPKRFISVGTKSLSLSETGVTFPTVASQTLHRDICSVGFGGARQVGWLTGVFTSDRSESSNTKARERNNVRTSTTIWVRFLNCCYFCPSSFLFSLPHVTVNGDLPLQIQRNLKIKWDKICLHILIIATVTLYR